MAKMIRLRETPSLYYVGSSTYVSSFDRKNWFIVCAETHDRKGKMYKGYLALWRFEIIYSSKQKAIKAARRWLGTPLI